MVLISLSVGFVVAYIWFYSRLVRFRVPRWMVLIDGRRSSQVEMEFVKVLPKSNNHAVNGHVQVAREESVQKGRQTEFWEAD